MTHQLVVGAAVGFAGVDIVVGVVVGEDDGGGTVGDHIGKDFTGMDGALIEQADCDDALFDDFVCAVERDVDEVLLRFTGNVGNESGHVFGAGDPDGVAQQMTPRPFSRGVGGHPQFPMRLVPVAMLAQRRQVLIGHGQVSDRLAGEVGRQPVLPVLMIPLDLALGLRRRRVVSMWSRDTRNTWIAFSGILKGREKIPTTSRAP